MQNDVGLLNRFWPSWSPPLLASLLRGSHTKSPIKKWTPVFIDRVFQIVLKDSRKSSPRDFFMAWQALSGQACDCMCTCPHMRIRFLKTFDKKHVQMKLFTTCFYYIITCSWSRDVALLYVLKTTFPSYQSSFSFHWCWQCMKKTISFC